MSLTKILNEFNHTRYTLQNLKIAQIKFLLISCIVCLYSKEDMLHNVSEKVRNNRSQPTLPILWHILFLVVKALQAKSYKKLILLINHLTRAWKFLSNTKVSTMPFSSDCHRLCLQHISILAIKDLFLWTLRV